MSNLRSILVHLDGTVRAEVRLRLAHRLAANHQASLTALFAVVPRYLPLFPLAGGMPSIPLPSDIDPDHRAHAMALFERTRDAGAPQCDWRELTGESVTEEFALQALTADLVVLGQRDPTDATGFDVPADFVESVVIDSGRPALVIPYVGEVTATPQTVLLAWKPTRESAHALSAALPFLQAAKRVHLVSAYESEADTQPVPPQPAEYLRLHGIERVHEHRWLDDSDAGDGLLSLAADTGADLIVMGCYGHSRARELVLGGATRTMLQSMTVPVLMAH